MKSDTKISNDYYLKFRQDFDRYGLDIYLYNSREIKRAKERLIAKSKKKQLNKEEYQALDIMVEIIEEQRKNEEE